MADLPCVSTPRHRFSVEGDPGAFRVSLTAHTETDGVDLVTLQLETDEPATPPALSLVWAHPLVDIQARWLSVPDRGRSLLPEWMQGFASQLTRDAPIACYHSLRGRNRMTFACSDPLNTIGIKTGVHEETATIRTTLGLFAEPHPPLQRYELTVRVDTRDVPYYEALQDVEAWWRSLPGGTPLPVPDAGRWPFYSTWYSFHQSLDPDAIIAQCRFAKELGCEAIIVDDGWQTLDTARGYAYAGDWQPVRIPDMHGLVQRVHDVGMKFLLWYSLPFAGKHSEAYNRFARRHLTHIHKGGAAVLDPQYPEVRAHLIDVLVKAMTEWELDGFKLDFLDWFDPRHAPTEHEAPDEMDHAHVSEAADRLMIDLVERLRHIRPDVLIEFRQPYTGPRMRRYGNLFRALDCPNDALRNRINTIDLRLICGDTAVHSDMLMWSPDEPAECAALQLLNVLFAVPQISVRLGRIPAAHVEMLRFWLGFWREHRDVLLDGRFCPMHPQLNYPSVVASTGEKRIVAVYDETVAHTMEDVPPELLIVNATRNEWVVLETPADLGRRRVQTWDCTGTAVADRQRTLDAGLHVLPIPPAGLTRVSALSAGV